MLNYACMHESYNPKLHFQTTDNIIVWTSSALATKVYYTSDFVKNQGFVNYQKLQNVSVVDRVCLTDSQMWESYVIINNICA